MSKLLFLGSCYLYDFLINVKLYSFFWRVKSEKNILENKKYKLLSIKYILLVMGNCCVRELIVRIIFGYYYV